ncbi:MAG: outer membrane protein assembly factor BamA [Acidobacteriales bacterium]|nr:outer membrane protein assembly factor BamA [Terriglobales bacterium]
MAGKEAKSDCNIRVRPPSAWQKGHGKDFCHATGRACWRILYNQGFHTASDIVCAARRPPKYQGSRVPSFATKKTKALGLFLILLTSLLAWGQGTGRIISDIQIHGNRRIPADTVRARMFTRAGDIFDPAALERDFASLWNTGYYEDIRIEKLDTGKGVEVHVYLKEKPTIRDIEYKGVSSVSVSDIYDRFKDRKVGLNKETQYDPTKVKKAEVVLKEFLAEKGRQFSTIRTEVRPIPPAAVGVTFIVKEGPKVKVGRIRYEGNKHVSSRALRSAMKNTKPIGIPRSIFLENLFSRTFDSTKLQEDAERVRNEYQERGHFKAIVGDPKTKMRDTGGSFINPFKRKPGKVVDITMPIEEGERFKLGSISFTGGKAVTNTKFLRALFPMKDGEIFSTKGVRKGLENMRKAYGELGYINFTPVPDTQINDEKKIIDLVIDLDEGKSYSVRRIEFTGNTTTRDKVIRREILLEEGNVYNSHLWEFSLQRLNQLQYFEPLNPEKDGETRRNDQDATVDLSLKVKEKGKNTIGLNGGVSGLSGSFIGINYETNNFLGLGETLRVEFNVGSFEKSVLFGFTDPYFLDKPLQFGFTVFTRRFDYNQARRNAILFNRTINLPQDVLNQFQNYSSSSTGFTVSLSYPLRRSFKRLGVTYSFDTSTITAFSDASRRLFENFAFRNVSGPNALKGVVTSKIFPSFTWNTLDNPQRPSRGFSLFAGGDIGGIGGNVASLRPVVEWKQFFRMKNLMPNKDEGRNVLAYRIQAAFITGYRGLVANPAERFYMGGEADIRGFAQRSLSPYVFITNQTTVPLINPDDVCAINASAPCQGVPKDPTNRLQGNWTIPVPFASIAIPGGDTNLVSNLEYRIPIVGPVTLAAFLDAGVNFISRQSQLRLTDANVTSLNNTGFGCTGLDPTKDFACTGTTKFPFDNSVRPVSGTNFKPRMSTGLELQVILPIVNAPFRIYYAYNPLRVDTLIDTPIAGTTREQFRALFPANAAGEFTYQRTLQQLAPSFRVKEPKKTFRITVATTF